MPRFKTIAITAKLLNVEAMIATLAGGVQIEGETVNAEYQKTTRTWKNEPEHKVIFKQTKQRISSLNITDNRIYFFIHGGTKVRRAVLSGDWISKTTPRFVGSGSGRGRVLFVSKKVALPGIKAREWTDVIAKDRAPKYKTNMEKLMVKIANKANARGQA